MIMCALVNVGMWFERFVIICTSLSRDFLPSNWHWYFPSYVEILTLMGSFGLFFTLFLLFCRYLPIVAMAEVKSILPQASPHYHGYEKQNIDQPGASGYAGELTSAEKE
jgi:molybdopterin-containing oxidoreductase family membrane subunit